MLKEYAKRYGARWTFLTVKAEGEKKKVEVITTLLDKLGLANPASRVVSKRNKLDGKADPIVKAEEARKQHTGMIVIGNVQLDKWNKASILSSPARILQMIERLKPPTSP